MGFGIEICIGAFSHGHLPEAGREIDIDIDMRCIFFCRLEFSINPHFQLSSFFSNEEAPI